AGTPSGAASPTIRKASATIWTVVFHLASRLTGTAILMPARNSRRPETTISRTRITTAGRMARPGRRSNAASISSAVATSSLSASGSRKRPKSECWARRRAMKPSKKSVTEAAAKSASAIQFPTGVGRKNAPTSSGITMTRDRVRMLGRLSRGASVLLTGCRSRRLVAPSLAVAVEMIVNFPGHRLADAVDGGEIVEPGTGDRPGRAEMVQERALAARPDARNFVQYRLPD